MSHIKQREFKMQEKRKNTPWREYLKTIVSCRSLTLHRNSGFVSVFPETKKVHVVSHKDFNEQRNNSLYVDYNINKSFFENFASLSQIVQLPPTILYGDCENSAFSDQTLGSKNCYLSFVVIRDCENILYSFSVKEHSTNIYNSIMVRDNSDNIFCSRGIIKSFKIFYSSYLIGCSDVRFSANLINCHDCLFCSDLENQSYHIHNIQYPKEEYLIKKKELLAQKNLFLSWYKDTLQTL